jgi:hypothetical protein
MNTASMTAVEDIPAIEYDEWIQLATAELDQLIDALARLSPDQWRAPTPCADWDVRAMAGHLLGMMRLGADRGELQRQVGEATRRLEAAGGYRIDHLTALQVEEHAGLTTDALLQQRELQIGIFAPRRREAFVEATRHGQKAARDEYIGGRELRSLEAARIGLIVGRRRGQRHDDSARGGGRALVNRSEPLLQPVRVGQRVVVGERDHRRARLLPAGIARARRTLRASHGHITHAEAALCLLVGEARDACAGRVVGTVVADHDLVAVRRKILLAQRVKTRGEQRRPTIGRHDHADVQM